MKQLAEAAATSTAATTVSAAAAAAASHAAAAKRCNRNFRCGTEFDPPVGEGGIINGWGAEVVGASCPRALFL